MAFAALLTIGSPQSTLLHAQQNQSARGFSETDLKTFAALRPIDSHTHIYEYAPEYVALLAKLHMHTLDIMVVSDNANPERKGLTKESHDVFDLVHRSDGRVFACTTFDAYRFNDLGFAKNAIAGLDRAFEEGAVAAKVWKNIGMEIKDRQGKYILPDDPALAPIYREITAKHKTLIMHIADPDTAWQPPNSNAPDQQYFIEHPEWYMYKIPGSPSKEQILEARDHVLRDNPHLKVVGAHLGSMEGDFDRIAADLDKYPNFAVDMTARMPYIMRLPRAKAIAFFTKYQDRLIYGTDDTLYPDNDVSKFVRGAENTYARDWRFLATDAQFSFRGIQSQGLALPESILRKIYHDNAVHWYTGMQ
ncbi:amidohydrolase [Acidipila sp. 4G-K13]|uniref:Amidohydrolase n=2 Tax=Paracidobacterium acidisoli TaxID=2303751 RepID=A0A372ILI4_9BACT|nr:amidohydrolase [Paracidobacterium acidisoli]